MARESFRDPLVAEILNRSFIPVKVDREENPEVDAYYMDYCMMAGGGCGWPLTVIAVPDGRPFYIATYMPREYLIQLLLAVEDAWSNPEKRRELYTIASRAGEAIDSLLQLPSGNIVDPRILYEQAYQGLSMTFDTVYGGFGTRPKFPMPRHISFLSRQAVVTGSTASLYMATHTLNHIASGGIHDIVGGGWHRYTIDRMWLQPHFEKMLYTQGLMIYATAEAVAYSGMAHLARPAIWALEFLEREMKVDHGLYGSALNAESGGMEGAYYTWTVDELEEADPGVGVNIVRLFNASREGNIIDEATGERLGVNVLYLGSPWEEKARELDMSITEFIDVMEKIRYALYMYRVENKPRPELDDKLLVDWNSLVTAGIARLSRTLRQVELANKASRIMDALIKGAVDGDLVTHLAYSDSRAGTLYDYSYIMMALVEVYHASLDYKYIETAVEISKAILKRFVARNGVMTLDGYKIRAPAEDTSLPSPVGIAAYYMLKTARIMGDDEIEEGVIGVLKAYMGLVERNPHSYLSLVESLILERHSRELVAASPEYSEDIAGMLKELRSPLVTPLYIHGEMRSKGPDYARSMIPIDGKNTFYLCRNKTCGLPTHDTDKIVREAEAPI